MYEQFYGLRTNPFSLTPDPEFLFLSDEHREAIAGLTYAVLGNRGFCVLTGDAGTGKTTLLRSLMRSMPGQRAVFSVVLNPVLTPAEFLRTCLADFGVGTHEISKDALLSQLHEFLLENHSLGRSAVLIIDEAHRLTVDLLEELRLLSNFETDKEKLLQIVLVGQDELSDLLDRYELRQLKQRIAIRLHIKALNSQAVASYVRYRWSRAGDSPCPFDDEALRSIAEVSSGIPRLVNSTCDNALLLAFSTGTRTVAAEAVAAAAKDLHLAYRPGQPVNGSGPTARLIADEGPAYQNFYDLRVEPFALTPDPDFVFLSQSHREAASGLMYGVLVRKAFCVLTGEAGTGKTTVIRSVIRSIPQSRALFSIVRNPTLAPAEFVTCCLANFGIQMGPSSKHDVLSRLERFLLETHHQNRSAVLIVDEAHRLTVDLLEEIRLLTNFQTDIGTLLQVVLVGQPGLSHLLNRHELRQLRQRVTVSFNIRPLNSDEVAAYVEHRWHCAGKSAVPFEPAALTAIAKHSGGIPRVVNSLCENVLLLGFATRRHQINENMVADVAKILAPDLREQEVPASASQANVLPASALTDESLQLCVPAAPGSEPDFAALKKYSPKRGWRYRLGLD